MSNNPFLQPFDTPFETVPFSKIKDDHYLPALEELINRSLQAYEDIKKNTEVTFENTIGRIEDIDGHLEALTNCFFNMNSAETNEKIQAISKDFSEKLTNFGNDITLDAELFKRIKELYKKKDSLEISAEGKRLLEKTYSTFVRNGALLDDDKKNRLREIDGQLAKKSLYYSDNVLAETNAFELVIDNEADLAGLPAFVREAAAELAKEKGHNGKWVISLDYPSYGPFMAYADNAELRKKMYYAMINRGNNGNENDNNKLALEIVNLRHQRAELLGYKTHADFILEKRMAETSDKVEKFLGELLDVSHPVAKKEMQVLKDYKNKCGESGPVERWDFSYYLEKLKKEKFNIDDEILKPYFSLENVINGAFTVANKLYNLSFEKLNNIDVYHPDVTTYKVTDSKGDLVAIFYADFFPRSGKRGGAWMTIYKEQKMIDGKDRRPHVAIVCNFSKPTATKPSLLNLDEVLTLFHEFGHALHGMLSKCEFGSLSGTNVYWDFVELPSQILENWVYEKECLDLFAEHFETKEKIPADLVKKIKESSTFFEGYMTIRQLSFAMLDMAWHSQNPNKINSVSQFEDEIFKLTDIFEGERIGAMSTAFSHIFAGGYSAGYYSYKWAEVLDADAFEAFLENGLFDQKTAKSFHDNILSRGGSEHPMELYKKFRGREPKVDALLKRAGLVS